MEGVLILNTFEVVEHAPGWSWWALIPLAFSIFFIAAMVISADDDIPRFLFSICMGMALAVFLVTILFAKELPPKTHYNVIINESVNFAEFNEKYEVIDQDGVIYTVIEKE